MAIRVLEETGLLPHLNPGVMTWEDLQRLKPVAPSMGMMLETTADVPAHRGSPDKVPAVRLRTIEDAGRSNDPVHHRDPGRHRRDRGRPGRVAVRAARAGAPVRPHPGSHRPELPRQARHRDAQQRTTSTSTPTSRRSRSRGWSSARRCGCRRRPTWSTSTSAAGCSPPESTTGAASRRSRRTTSTPSGPGRISTTSPRVSRRVRLHADRAAHRAPALPRRAMARPAAAPHVEALRDDRRPGTAGASRRPGLPWQEPDGGWDDAGRTDLFEAIDTEGRRERRGRTSTRRTARGSRSRSASRHAIGAARSPSPRGRRAARAGVRGRAAARRARPGRV